MNTRLKTRSDYHIFSPNPSGISASNVMRFIKPLFWLGIGALLGMMYNKRNVDACYELLAFNEAEQKTLVATVEPSQSLSKPKSSKA